MSPFTNDIAIDDRTREALSRLTENEKLCLRRRLRPQTAKEMAIELGISPHAVEKRLKMARAKLGLSSSLAAARLLARVEADQHLVPQAPDLPGDAPRQQEGVGAARPDRKRVPRLLSGGLPMIAALSLMALLAQDAPAPPPARTASAVLHLDQMPVRKVDMNEAAAFNAEDFHFKDVDGSGFLEPREVSALELRDANRDSSLPPAPPAGSPDPAAERKWMAKLDANRDGKVSEEEYIDYMTPWTLWQGVPAAWHAKR